jgi:hypothetical protein
MWRQVLSWKFDKKFEPNAYVKVVRCESDWHMGETGIIVKFNPMLTGINGGRIVWDVKMSNVAKFSLPSMVPFFESSLELI